MLQGESGTARWGGVSAEGGGQAGDEGGGGEGGKIGRE